MELRECASQVPAATTATAAIRPTAASLAHDSLAGKDGAKVAPASSGPPARGDATDPALGAFPAEIRAPAPVVVAQAPAPKPVQDRWHRLADALNRCPADDVIARTVCQESLRIDQCEGYWGRVAPCPARQDREYGN